MTSFSRIWLLLLVVCASSLSACKSGKTITFEKLKAIGNFLGDWVPEPTTTSESAGSGQIAEADRITLTEILPGIGGQDRYHRQRGLFDHILPIELKSKDGIQLRGRNIRIAWKHARTAEAYQLMIWPADSQYSDTLRQWRFFTTDNDLAIDDRLEWGAGYHCLILGYNGVVEVARSDTFRFALAKDSLKTRELKINLPGGKKEEDKP